MIKAELTRSGFIEQISSGIVLTGGSSLLPGMVELAEEIFHVPVRVGVPNYSGGLAERVRNPRYATSVGLLIAGLEQRDPATFLGEGGVSALAERMKRWFKDVF